MKKHGFICRIQGEMMSKVNLVLKSNRKAFRAHRVVLFTGTFVWLQLEETILALHLPSKVHLGMQRLTGEAVQIF